jgi:hypothetical protein
MAKPFRRNHAKIDQQLVHINDAGSDRDAPRALTVTAAQIETLTHLVDVNGLGFDEIEPRAVAAQPHPWQRHGLGRPRLCRRLGAPERIVFRWNHLNT